jgi:type VI protein secretion system component VasF
MISRQEYNELIRKAGRERLKTIRDRYHDVNARIYDSFSRDHAPLTDKEKQEIKSELRARSRNSRRLTLVVFSLAILVFGFVCYMILLSLSRV